MRRASMVATAAAKLLPEKLRGSGRLPPADPTEST
jgi:hypothetical protein